MTGPATPDAVRIERLDPLDARHAAALVELLDEYARDPMGGGAALSADARARLPALLASRPHYVGLLAYDGDRPVGLVNAFEGVSTFKARPLLNVHDIAVAATHRGRGLGRRLLAELEAIARARDCCKLTLEALEGNVGAIGLYRSVGFRAYELDPAMGRATFFEKRLD
ncbi:MAG TPA: GNAT family N-acetyltransferase [Burkholderiaceae bacterium]|nr:GNAT family N-acetyltransferase [Burkholderiaceae bacterium]